MREGSAVVAAENSQKAQWMPKSISFVAGRSHPVCGLDLAHCLHFKVSVTRLLDQRRKRKPLCFSFFSNATLPQS